MYILNNLKIFLYYVFCIFLCSYAGGCQKKEPPSKMAYLVYDDYKKGEC